MAIARTITFRGCLLTNSGNIIAARDDGSVGLAYVDTSGWDVAQVHAQTVSGTDASWGVTFRTTPPGASVTPYDLSTAITLTHAAKASALFSLPSGWLLPVVTDTESATIIDLFVHLRAGVSVGVQS
jgi:hypothetical protein